MDVEAAKGLRAEDVLQGFAAAPAAAEARQALGRRGVVADVVPDPAELVGGGGDVPGGGEEGADVGGCPICFSKEGGW